MKHTWTWDETVITEQAFRADKKLSRELAEEIGVPLGSLRWKYGNCKALRGEGNATHISKMHRQVFDELNRRE
jgi:hypothetical protein